MLIPLLLGSIVRTFAPRFLELGSFTSALFRDSALPLIALLVLATYNGPIKLDTKSGHLKLH